MAYEVREIWLDPAPDGEFARKMIAMVQDLTETCKGLEDRMRRLERAPLPSEEPDPYG